MTTLLDNERPVPVAPPRANLIVEVGDRRYAVPLDRVSQVVDAIGATMVMQPPDYRVGFVSYRGQAIPAVDLRLSLGCPGGISNQTRVIVVTLDLQEWKNHRVGLIVDRLAALEPHLGRRRSRPRSDSSGPQLLDIDALFRRRAVRVPRKRAGTAPASKPAERV